MFERVIKMAHIQNIPVVVTNWTTDAGFEVPGEHVAAGKIATLQPHWKINDPLS